MTPLKAEIIALIRDEGPISIARYMELALGHPTHGYYMTRDPFGAAGDFTTAPETSQMFGELIGLWFADLWSRQGALPRVILAEAGPGRGTLMADMLRAATKLPAFRAAASVHLIETSPVLRDAQAAMLGKLGVTPVWHAALDTLPDDAPIYLIGNEFLDALPIRQFERRDGSWRERLVGLCDGSLAFGLAPDPEPALAAAAPEGSLLEISPASFAFVQAAAARLVNQGGAALFIDYGHDRSGLGDTLQAMKSHRFVDPLAAPGEADLTAHVDFAAMAEAGRRGGATIHGPVTQGAFLKSLGIDARAERLMAGASAEAAAAIASQRERLVDPAERGMGRLFKALALTPPDSPAPAGF